MRRIGQSLGLLALASLLAACGEGGGSGGASGGGATGSTPTPTPSTPTPTPSTPTPTPSNTALSTLTVDGDFATVAGETNEIFPAGSGSGNSFNSAFVSLAAHYAASTQGYSLTVGTRSQTFLPANIDNTRSLPGLVFYDRSTASLIDYFARVRPAAAAAVPIYYVGIGGWGRTQTETSPQGPSTWGDAFIYGFPTAAAAVPTTGTRRYAADGLSFTTPGGNAALTDRLTRRIGEGEIIADFAAHTVTLSFTRHNFADSESSIATANAVDIVTGTGTIAADGSFTGTFACPGCAASTPLTQFQGKLYGPAAEEIGLTYAGSNPRGTGSLVGHQRGKFDANVIDTGFSSIETTLSTGGSWQFGLTDYDLRVGAAIDAPNRFSTIADRYFIHTYLGGSVTSPYRENPFSFAATIPAETTPEYIVYGYSLAATASGPQADQRLYFLNPLAVDAGLTLNSLKLGRFERRESTGRHSDIFFASGASAPAAGIPTSGTAHYVGVIAGQYFPTEGGGTSYSYLYGIDGTIDLTIDFAAHTVTGSFHPTARKSSDNSMVDMGIFPITGGTIDASGTITASLATNPNSYYVSLRGGLSGQLYGASAGELGLQTAFRTCHYCFATAMNSYDAFYAAGVTSRR